MPPLDSCTMVLHAMYSLLLGGILADQEDFLDSLLQCLLL